MLVVLALGVWGELASHIRSSTHCPSSQDWASSVLLHSVCYVLCVVCFEGRFGLLRLGFCFFLSMAPLERGVQNYATQLRSWQPLTISLQSCT